MLEISKKLRKEIYSTEETFTGEYWEDGKKIYKKVITTTMTAVTTRFNLAELVDTLVDAYGTIGVENNAMVHKIGGYANSNFYSLLQYDFRTKQLSIWGTNGYVNNNLKLTLKYTKTTD